MAAMMAVGCTSAPCNEFIRPPNDTATPGTQSGAAAGADPPGRLACSSATTGRTALNSSAVGRQRRPDRHLRLAASRPSAPVPPPVGRLTACSASAFLSNAARAGCSSLCLRPQFYLIAQGRQLRYPGLRVNRSMVSACVSE